MRKMIVGDAYLCTKSYISLDKSMMFTANKVYIATINKFTPSLDSIRETFTTTDDLGHPNGWALDYFIHLGPLTKLGKAIFDVK